MREEKDDWEVFLEMARTIAWERFGRRARRLALELDDGEMVWMPIPSAGRTDRDKRKRVASHAPGFRSVWWFGDEYTFTETQSKVVSVLWEAWEQGTRDVGQDVLMMAAGSAGVRLYDLFRKSPAWQTLIVSGEHPGSYRLRLPDEPMP